LIDFKRKKNNQKGGSVESPFLFDFCHGVKLLLFSDARFGKENFQKIVRQFRVNLNEKCRWGYLLCQYNATHQPTIDRNDF